MKYSVHLVEDAESDMTDIVRFIAEKESLEMALAVLTKIESLCDGLEQFPSRGNYPPELHKMGITHFRETRYKPYRIIYEIVDEKVFVQCILDGRRDMLSLLKRRLLR